MSKIQVNIFQQFVELKKNFKVSNQFYLYLYIYTQLKNEILNAK